VFELQADWTDNVALAPVRLLDLVDLQVPNYQVSFSSFPWISARVFNAGIRTAPPFYVDFYQVRAGGVRVFRAVCVLAPSCVDSAG
jgi:hypothetical protein